jgi:hypothetical protein
LKTEYYNVAEPARRSLVQWKQTNKGIGSNAATATPASSTLQPQPTYAAGAPCYRRQWGQKGRNTSASGGVNYMEWRGGSEPEEGHPQSTKLTHHHLPLLLVNCLSFLIQEKISIIPSGLRFSSLHLL